MISPQTKRTLEMLEQIKQSKDWDALPGDLMKVLAACEDLAVENAKLRKELVEAALEIHCAGPVAHRIRVLKETHYKTLARIREVAEKWRECYPAQVSPHEFRERMRCADAILALLDGKEKGE